MRRNVSLVVHHREASHGSSHKCRRCPVQVGMFNCVFLSSVPMLLQSIAPEPATAHLHSARPRYSSVISALSDFPPL